MNTYLNADIKSRAKMNLPEALQGQGRLFLLVKHYNIITDIKEIQIVAIMEE